MSQLIDRFRFRCRCRPVQHADHPDDQPERTPKGNGDTAFGGCTPRACVYTDHGRGRVFDPAGHWSGRRYGLWPDGVDAAVAGIKLRFVCCHKLAKHDRADAVDDYRVVWFRGRADTGYTHIPLFTGRWHDYQSLRTKVPG